MKLPFVGGLSTEYPFGFIFPLGSESLVETFPLLGVVP